MSDPWSDGSVVHPARVDALKRRIETLENDLLGEVEPLQEECADLRQTVEEQQQEIEELRSQLEAVGTSDVEANTPDERAMKIRSWLYSEAEDSRSDTASLDKEVAKGVLGSGLTREQRYEAMRRAADGDEGARSGSSSLAPADGFEFQKFDDPERLSRVVVDLDDLTGYRPSSNKTTEVPSDEA